MERAYEFVGVGGGLKENKNDVTVAFGFETERTEVKDGVEEGAYKDAKVCRCHETGDGFDYENVRRCGGRGDVERAGYNSSSFRIARLEGYCVRGNEVWRGEAWWRDL